MVGTSRILNYKLIRSSTVAGNVERHPHQNTAAGILKIVPLMDENAGAVWNVVDVPIVVIEAGRVPPSHRIGADRNAAYPAAIVGPRQLESVDVETKEGANGADVWSARETLQNEFVHSYPMSES